MKAEIFHQGYWINCSESHLIKKIINEALDHSFCIIGMLQHNFTPHGFTCVWLLAESHLAVHSFPEENKCYIELSSCSSPKSSDFWKIFFKKCEIELISIEEGVEFNEKQY